MACTNSLINYLTYWKCDSHKSVKYTYRAIQFHLSCTSNKKCSSNTFNEYFHIIFIFSLWNLLILNNILKKTFFVLFNICFWLRVIFLHSQNEWTIYFEVFQFKTLTRSILWKDFCRFQNVLSINGIIVSLCVWD